MTLRMYTQSVVEVKVKNEVTAFTVSIYVAEETEPSKPLANKVVEIDANQTVPQMRIELKDKLRDFWEKVQAEEQRRTTMFTQTQSVLDDMMTTTTT